MIVGIGTDVVLISRFEEIYQRHSSRFAEKFLAKAEWDDYLVSRFKPAFLAKRFAAKEAFAKALGTGIRGFWFTDLVVSHDNLGKPSIQPFGNCLVIYQSLNIQHSHLSISDEKNSAQAFVVLEK